jgi:hypothetical protein
MSNSILREHSMMPRFCYRKMIALTRLARWQMYRQSLEHRDDAIQTGAADGMSALQTNRRRPKKSAA